MSWKKLDILLQSREYPAVSVLCPVDRLGPDCEQSGIYLRDRLREATTHLLEGCPRQDVRPLVERLESLIASVHPGTSAGGLAIYAKKNWGTVIHLPFPVRERVEIGDAFVTHELMQALGWRPRYRVLAIDEGRVWLYEAIGRNLVEVSRGAFPLEVGSGYGSAVDRLHSERERTVSAVGERSWDLPGEALNALSDPEDPLPLVVLGRRRALASFEARPCNRLPVVATAVAEGLLTPQRLAREAEPLIAEWIRSQSHIASPRSQKLSLN